MELDLTLQERSYILVLNEGCYQMPCYILEDEHMPHISGKSVDIQNMLACVSPVLVFLQIVTKSTKSLTLDLLPGIEAADSVNTQSCGKLIVHAEECIGSKTTTEIIFRCSDLEHKNLFSRSVCARFDLH